MRQRRDRVEAEIAPELEPDVVPDFWQDRGLEPGFLEQRCDLLHALGDFTVRLAESELVAGDVLDDTGGFDLGGGIDRAADHALRPDRVPLPVARIDALNAAVGILAFEA